MKHKLTLATFRKGGHLYCKCPQCKRAQPLYMEGDHTPQFGYGGPYQQSSNGTVHPEFVCMAHHEDGGNVCLYMGEVSAR